VSALALSIGPVVGGALTIRELARDLSSSTSQSPSERSLRRCSRCASRVLMRRSTGGLDYPGIVALTASLTAIVLALIEATAGAGPQAQVLGLLAEA